MEVLDGSAVGRALADAHTRGAVLVGCSAGAMVLAGYTFDFGCVSRHGRSAGGTGSGSLRVRRSCPTTTPGRSRCPP